jgi:hypothetical protein
VISAINTVEADYQTAARGLLLALFPRLQSVFSNIEYTGASETEWDKAKRLCSKQYFQRYFSYAIPAGDISDRQIDGLLTASAGGNSTIGSQQIANLLSGANPEALITKLSQRSDEMSANTVIHIAKELVRHGGSFSRSGGFATLSTFTLAGGLVRDLVSRIPKGQQRLALAQELFREATPIGFGAECLSWLRAGSNTTDPNRIFSEQDEEKLGRILAKRIRLNADCALIRDEPQLLRLMYIWKHFGRQPDAPRLFLRKCFRAEPQLAVRYLRSAVGTAYPVDGGQPQPGWFDHDAYTSALSYADADVIKSALAKVFTKLPKYAESDIPSDHDERIAHQFIVLHNRRSAQRAQDAAPTKPTG